MIHKSEPSHIAFVCCLLLSMLNISVSCAFICVVSCIFMCPVLCPVHLFVPVSCIVYFCVLYLQYMMQYPSVPLCSFVSSRWVRCVLLYCRVRSDKVLFAILKNGHNAADRVYFHKFHSEKSPYLVNLAPKIGKIVCVPGQRESNLSFSSCLTFF